ncbi:MAG: serine hydroxymethyltransferase [bacterium]
MLNQLDPKIFDLISKEEARQKETISLIPSESECYDEIKEIMASSLNNKYSEGYPFKRYYNGNKFIDEIEQEAIDRTKEVFKSNFANVQAYSGSPANQAIYMALINPGDKVLGFDLGSGGHLTHGAKVNFSSKYYSSETYGVNKETELLDYDEIQRIAEISKPKLIVCGTTAYSRKLDFKKFSEIAKSVGAYLLADISHITALVVTGEHESPVGLADAVMTTTHKSLRGPRGAVILSNDEEIAKKIDKAVFPGLQGGPHNATTAAIAFAMKMAMTDEFKEYGKKIIENRIILEEILKKNNFRLVSGGSDNHLLVIDLRDKNISGKDAANKLEELGIIVNANSIPYDPNPPFKPSGIRIGTPIISARKYSVEKVAEIGNLISSSLIN